MVLSTDADNLDGAVTVPSLLAVVLAAGAGSRWRAAGGDGHKLLADLHGRPVVWHAVHAAKQSGCDVVVVTGAVDVSAVVPKGVMLLHNPRWAAGQSTSLQVAVDEATRRGVLGIVVGLGDQPDVPGSAWKAVVDETFDPLHPISVASYEGVRGQPVRLLASVWPLLPAEGDEGARSVLRVRPELVREVACSGPARQLADIDLPEDLRSWN